MSNRVTLDQLATMPIGEIAALPADMLKLLQDDVLQEAETAKQHASYLSAALDIRYAGRARAQLVADGKDAGTVNIADGEFIAKVEIPKQVDWDQGELRHAVDTVKSWGSNPDEFVTTKLGVSETSFKAWPSEIKAVFAPARTVSTGKPKVKIEAAKTRAA